MLTAERHEWIRRKLAQGGSIPLEMLARELGISMATAYRDMAALEGQGALTLNRGVVRPARAPGGRGGADAAPVAHRPSELRQLGSIASAAVELITENDSLFIGEGLVCYLLAQKIRGQPRFTHLIVVTNSFGVAIALHGHVRHLYLIGGELLQNADNLYTGGSRLTSNLSTILVNKAFASVDGIDERAGYTMQELSQLNILSQLPSFASSTVFLALSDRFGNRSIHQLAPLDFANVIITDSAIAPDMRRQYEALKRPQLIVADG